jgi:hypothetical protein
VATGKARANERTHDQRMKTDDGQTVYSKLSNRTTTSKHNHTTTMARVLTTAPPAAAAAAQAAEAAASSSESTGQHQRQQPQQQQPTAFVLLTHHVVAQQPPPTPPPASGASDAPDAYSAPDAFVEAAVQAAEARLQSLYEMHVQESSLSSSGSRVPTTMMLSSSSISKVLVDAFGLNDLEEYSRCESALDECAALLERTLLPRGIAGQLPPPPAADFPRGSVPACMRRFVQQCAEFITPVEEDAEGHGRAPQQQQQQGRGGGGGGGGGRRRMKRRIRDAAWPLALPPLPRDYDDDASDDDVVVMSVSCGNTSYTWALHESIGGATGPTEHDPTTTSTTPLLGAVKTTWKYVRAAARFGNCWIR